MKEIKKEEKDIKLLLGKSALLGVNRNLART